MLIDFYSWLRICILLVIKKNFSHMSPTIQFLWSQYKCDTSLCNSISKVYFLWSKKVCRSNHSSFCLNYLQNKILTTFFNITYFFLYLRYYISLNLFGTWKGKMFLNLIIHWAFSFLHRKNACQHYELWSSNRNCKFKTWVNLHNFVMSFWGVLMKPPSIF